MVSKVAKEVAKKEATDSTLQPTDGSQKEEVEVQQEKSSENDTPTEATDTVTHELVASGASSQSYKDAMIPNSVRKRLRAEKKALKSSTSETTETTEETLAETEETQTATEEVGEKPKKSRFGNLFNLESQQAYRGDREDVETSVLKPVAIGESEIIQPAFQAGETVAEGDLSQVSKKSKSKDREFHNLANLQEFSIDQFTEESERLKAEGKLDEFKRPMTSIGGGKHQISTLLRQAQDNKEHLEATFAQNRKTQQESGAKYAF